MAVEVTSVVPSLRLVVPSIGARTPVAGFGFAVVVSCGQAVAHAPEQLLLSPWSFSNR